MIKMWWQYATSAVVIGYIIFVYQSYRYSAPNIGNKMLAKYTVGKQPSNYLFYNFSDVVCDPPYEEAHATMSLQNKETLAVVSSEQITLNVKPTCSVFDVSCISV